MALLVADCPRCQSKRITFVVKSSTLIESSPKIDYYEAFCICRNCIKSTIFVLFPVKESMRTTIKSHGVEKLSDPINELMNIKHYISLKDNSPVEPPEHIPENIKNAFNEGATCLATGCYNASAAMFRLCVDMSTRQILPESDENGLNKTVRRSLGLRLNWLFDNNLLPESMRELATCIKEDGNDGVHAGSLTKDDAEDILDFTIILLERMYTEPERLRIAQKRREERRTPQGN